MWAIFDASKLILIERQCNFIFLSLRLGAEEGQALENFFAQKIKKTLTTIEKDFKYYFKYSHLVSRCISNFFALIIRFILWAPIVFYSGFG